MIIPARNEARHIEDCVRSVRAQEIEGELEVIVVDERSSDATAELARAAGAKVVDDPERCFPSALNRRLATTRADVVARFDAHGAMPAGYLEACLRALDEVEGAATVGGWCEVRANGNWGRALGTALASPVGIGNASRWRRPAAGAPRRDVNTVHFGCFSQGPAAPVGGLA